MDSSKIKLIFIVVMAMIAALYLGVSAATAQFEAIAWVVGGVTLCTCLLMGRNIWLLIPFLGSMQLTLMIPGRPSSMLFAQALVITFTVLLLLSRKIQFKLQITEMESWMLLLTLCVIQVYVRNPVGVSLFGGDQVGGRPYVLYVMAFITAFILASVLVTPKSLWLALKLSILGSLCNFAVGLVSWFWAPFGQYFGMANSLAISSNTQTVVDADQAGRIEFLRSIANTLAVLVSSFRNPLLAVFNMRFAPLVITSLIFAAGSGYRNVVASVGLSYLVGVIYRGGLSSLIGSMLLGVVGVASLAVINIAVPLPANLQRAMAFLPGTWDERYVLDTKSSSDWRFEMWEEVLTTDRWIENKMLGDGLGFSSKELQWQSQMLGKNRTNSVGVSGFDQGREFVMINGDYHSGPVSAIRTVGYVGLFIMLLAQLRIMMHAHRLVLRFKGSDYFPLVLYFCIPIIWFPVFFIFIFGGFQGDAIAILLNAGMIRLLQNNLPNEVDLQAAT
jgi:hypothetical protein